MEKEDHIYKKMIELIKNDTIKLTTDLLSEINSRFEVSPTFSKCYSENLKEYVKLLIEEKEKYEDEEQKKLIFFHINKVKDCLNYEKKFKNDKDFDFEQNSNYPKTLKLMELEKFLLYKFKQI